MSAPPGSDPVDSYGSSSSSSEGDTNNGSGKASSRGRRSQSIGSTTSSVFGSSKLRATKFEKNSGSGKWKEAAIFDNWVNDAMDILEVGELDAEARQAMIRLGWHLEGEAKILHASYRKNPETKNNTVPEFLKVLRKFCVPFISDDKLWTEFQAIRQTQNSRTKPIQQVANKINQLQILLPKISDWQCYNQLLEAMDPALLQEVGANINDEMDWDDLIEFCSKHDLGIHKHTSIKKDHKSKNGQKMRQQNHTPQASSNPAPTNTSWTKPKPFTRPSNMSSKFKKLTPAEKEELAKKGRCFYCRKTSHNAVNCPLKKNQIRSAAGTITHEITEVTHPSKITSAAQFILEDPPTPHTKGNSSQPPLDAAKEHLLVTMKINDQPAKTVVDQQTAGADLISSKFCTLHNLPCTPSKIPLPCR